jgi:hypothetical protein
VDVYSLSVAALSGIGLVALYGSFLVCLWYCK